MSLFRFDTYSAHELWQIYRLAAGVRCRRRSDILPFGIALSCRARECFHGRDSLKWDNDATYTKRKYIQRDRYLSLRIIYVLSRNWEHESFKICFPRVLLLGHGSKWESWLKFFSRYSALYGNSVISYNRLSFLTLLFSSGPFVPNSDWQRIVRRPRMLFFSPATELIPLLILRSRSVPVERGPRETSGFTDQTRLSSLHNGFVAWYSYVVRLDDDIQNSKLKYSNLRFRLH